MNNCDFVSHRCSDHIAPIPLATPNATPAIAPPNRSTADVPMSPLGSDPVVPKNASMIPYTIVPPIMPANPNITGGNPINRPPVSSAKRLGPPTTPGWHR